jgi:transcriptional regulator with XRE-family HTH domain
VAQPDRVLSGLGRAIRAARIERGISQEALSLETGVHRNYIGGIERGERSPSVVAVIKLAAALETSLGELFTEAERFRAR